MELYDYQKEAVQALLSGKHFVIAPTGTGKSAMGLAYAKATGRRKVLVVTTASVRDQHNYDDEAPIWCGEDWMSSLSSFTVISWAGLAKWTQANWDSLEDYAVIADETACLPASAKVATICGIKDLANIQVGDLVLSYNHELERNEYKRVSKTYKLPSHEQMYCLRSQTGAIISTADHPHYTQRGYVEAQYIKPGDMLYELCDLPQAHHSTQLQPASSRKIKQECVLQLRMRNASQHSQQPPAQQTDGGSTQNKQVRGSSGVQSMWEADTDRGMDTSTSTHNGAKAYNLLRPKLCCEASHRSDGEVYADKQPFSKTRVYPESQRNSQAAGDKTNLDGEARVKRWQRAFHKATTDVVWATERDRDWVENGADSIVKGAAQRLSQPLQARYRKQYEENRSRVRWDESQFSSSQAQGQEEGRKIEGTRVESVEILELRDIREFGLYRDPDHVYCIDVEDNHNFYADGFLTHNCMKAGISSNRGKAFLQIANRTDTWAGFTATPGDRWIDFYAYFTACGKVKNKTQFQRDYCIMQTYRGYPEIIGYRNEQQLKDWWAELSYVPDASKVLAELPAETNQTVLFKQPAGYKQTLKTHETLDREFLDNASAMCHYLRQLCCSKQKLDWLTEFVEHLPTSCVVFYNYTEEGDQIETTLKKKVGKVWRIDGADHDIPKPETIGKHDVVLVQYMAGSMGLNLQFMNYCVFFSPNYSYTLSVQSKGRIKRIGQTKHCHYYYLKCKDTIEEDVYKILSNKGEFSEENWLLGKENK